MRSPFSPEPILDQIVDLIDYTPEEWDHFLQQFCSEVAYQGWLDQQGVTPQDFESWVRRELAIRKFQHRQWGRKITSYFLDRKHQLDRVICSLIYVNDPGLAQELYFRIVGQEATFAEVALTYSQMPEEAAMLRSHPGTAHPPDGLSSAWAGTGRDRPGSSPASNMGMTAAVGPDGRMGPVELGQLHPRLSRLFYGASPGQLWEPIAIHRGWVIARLEESLPVQFDDFMRQSLLNELLEDWLKAGQTL